MCISFYQRMWEVSGDGTCCYVCLCVINGTCDTEGLLSRPLFVRLSRPFREEKRPFFRCLQVRDKERLLTAASSLEQI